MAYTEDEKKTTPTQRHIAAAINALLERGFEEDGETRGERYRIITAISYPLAGAEINTGGRKRFVIPGTSYKITIGARSVCGYRVLTNEEYHEKRETAKLKHLVERTEGIGRLAKTKDLDAVIALADEVCGLAGAQS